MGIGVECNDGRAMRTEESRETRVPLWKMRRPVYSSNIPFYDQYSVPTTFLVRCRQALIGVAVHRALTGAAPPISNLLVPGQDAALCTSPILQQKRRRRWAEEAKRRELIFECMPRSDRPPDGCTFPCCQRRLADPRPQHASTRPYIHVNFRDTFSSSSLASFYEPSIRHFFSSHILV